jgi:adenylate cyclase
LLYILISDLDGDRFSEFILNDNSETAEQVKFIVGYSLFELNHILFILLLSNLIDIRNNFPKWAKTYSILIIISISLGLINYLLELPILDLSKEIPEVLGRVFRGLYFILAYFILGIGLISATITLYIRNFPQARSDQEKGFPTLSQAAAGIPVGAVELPGPRDLIRYYGPGRTVPIVSFWEVLQDPLPTTKEVLKDAIVFVGLLMRSDTGGAQKDSYLSPFGPPMIFGVEVHATIVGNLLDKRWISRPPAGVEVLAQGALMAGVSFIALSATPVVLASIVGVCVVVWCLASFLLLGQSVFLAGAATVLVLLPMAVLVSALVSYVSARRAEESLRSAFSLYVSPDMVPKLQQEGGALKLGGEKMWLTAIFTDIADFTSITEEMPAERTSEMLNAYFTEVMEVVFKNQGTLLKFIGDAIFAIWGAPIKIQNHAELALQTALAINREVERFNATQRFPPLKTRIGVHTGPMLVGNLGSVKRFDYTAIGDSVNLASRIEGLNKYFGTTILFTEATRKDAGGFAGAVLVGSVRVKGRKEAVSLYSIFDPPLPPNVLDSWNRAYGAFCRADFTGFRAEVAGTLSSEPRLAKALDMYGEQAGKYLEVPPPQGWSGEVDFDHK